MTTLVMKDLETLFQSFSGVSQSQSAVRPNIVQTQQAILKLDTGKKLTQLKIKVDKEKKTKNPAHLLQISILFTSIQKLLSQCVPVYHVVGNCNVWVY